MPNLADTAMGSVGVVAFASAIAIWAADQPARPVERPIPAASTLIERGQMAIQEGRLGYRLDRRGQEESVADLLVFWDYECRTCAPVYESLVQFLKSRNDLRTAIQPLPVAGERAENAALAAICAAKQGRFPEMHVALTDQSGRGRLPTFVELARGAGVKDISDFAQCLESPDTEQELAASLEEARELHVPAVPYVIRSGGERLPLAAWGVTQVRQLLEASFAGRPPAASLLPDVSRYDSARIAVTFSRGERAADTVRTAAEPSLVIAQADAERPLFRVLKAIQLDSTTIVVANAGTNELYYFDHEGRLTTRAGAAGDGPGEFRMLVEAGGSAGGTLWTFDLRLKRFYEWTASGTLLTSMTLTRQIGDLYQPQIGGVFADGSFVIYQKVQFLASPGPAGFERDSLTIFRYNPKTDSTTALLKVAGQEYVIYETAQGGRYGRDARAFGKGPVIATDNGRLFTGETDRFEIRVYSDDGSLDRVVRRSWESVPVTDEDWMIWRDARLEEVSDAALRTRLDEHLRRRPPPPEFMPVLSGEVFVDDGDRMWVGEYVWPPDSEQRWSVFGPSGDFERVVLTPSGLTVTDVGEDWVMGIWKDSFGVESVRRFELEVPGGAGSIQQRGSAHRRKGEE